MKLPSGYVILNTLFQIMRGETMNRGLSIATLALGALITMLGTAIVAVSVASMGHQKMEF